MAEPIIDDLILYANGELDEAAEELGMERAEVEAAMVAIRQDAADAAKAQDLDHIAALRWEVPAVLTRAAIHVRDANRKRAYRMMGEITRALFSLIAKVAAPALLLCLFLAPGCILHRNTVPSDGIKGLVNQVCDVANQCAEDGRAQFIEQCDPLQPGSLPAELEDSKTISGLRLSLETATVCDTVKACLGRWDDLPDYRRRSYLRWCDVLEDTAAAALAE